MKYKEALEAWGRKRLSDQYGVNYRATKGDVTVEMEFTEGYACCGGRDPDCYCSLAEPPSANVVIRHGPYNVYISADQFDFSGVLREIIEAAGGEVTE